MTSCNRSYGIFRNYPDISFFVTTVCSKSDICFNLLSLLAPACSRSTHLKRRNAYSAFKKGCCQGFFLRQQPFIFTLLFQKLLLQELPLQSHLLQKLLPLLQSPLLHPGCHLHRNRHHPAADHHRRHTLPLRC